jgi:hypothetical protein
MYGEDVDVLEIGDLDVEMVAHDVCRLEIAHVAPSTAAG